MDFAMTHRSTSGLWSKARAFALVALTTFVGGFGAALITSDGAEAVPRKVRKACRNDYKTLCPHYRAGTSRMRSCMRANGSQLSWRCYQALSDYGYVDGRRRGHRRRRR